MPRRTYAETVRLVKSWIGRRACITYDPVHVPGGSGAEGATAQITGTVLGVATRLGAYQHEIQDVVIHTGTFHTLRVTQVLVISEPPLPGREV